MKEFSKYSLTKQNRLIQKTIESLFSRSINQIRNKLQRQTVSGLFGIDDAEVDLMDRMSKITAAYDNLENAYAKFSKKQIHQALKEGHNVAAIYLEKVGVEGVDPKTIGIFTKDMLYDFRRATTGGKQVIGSFFTFSKQGILTESEMTDAMARGWIAEGSGRSGKWSIAEQLRAKLHTSDIASLSDKEVDGLVKTALAKYRARGVPPQFLASFEKMLRDDKFLRIVNKNGDYMHFRVSKYAEFVARTRTANAQVHGTIEESSRYGITLYRVTEHNTESAICKPHEGKIYTVDPRDTRYPQLEPDNRPIYHINCLHRLIPYVEEAVLTNVPKELTVSPFTGDLQISDEAKENIEELFGKDATPRHIAELAGANGSDMEARIAKHGIKLNIRIKAKSDVNVYIDRDLYKDQQGKLVVHNSYHRDQRKPGQGLRNFENQVYRGIQFGVDRFETDPARYDSPDPNLRMNGYYTWPRYGYEVEFTQSDIDMIVNGPLKKYKNYRKISQIMATDTGRDDWMQHGFSLKNAVFSLKKGGENIRIFLEYLRGK